MYLNANYAHKEEIMNHNFPCTPEGGKISQLNPIIDYNKSILGGMYLHVIANVAKNYARKILAIQFYVS